MYCQLQVLHKLTCVPQENKCKGKIRTRSKGAYCLCVRNISEMSHFSFQSVVDIKTDHNRLARLSSIPRCNAVKPKDSAQKSIITSLQWKEHRSCLKSYMSCEKGKNPTFKRGCTLMHEMA